MKQRTWLVVNIVVAVVFAAFVIFGVAKRYTATTPSPAPDAVLESPPVSEEKMTPPTPESDFLDSGEWNTYHGDSALRGVATSEWTPPLSVRWRLKAGGPVRQTPVVSNDRVFVATARGEILSADLHGNLAWSRELQKGVAPDGHPLRHRIDAPIACFDDVLLVGTADGTLFALETHAGEERWQHKLDGTILGTPNYRAADPAESSASGSVYVLQQSDGVLVCLDAATGRERWRGEAVDRSDASPSLSNEAIVFGSCAAALHVFDPNTGDHLRDIEIDPDSQVAGGVALVDGRVVSGSRSGKIIEADIASGETIWVNEASEAEIFATPAVTADWVVAADYDGIVYGLDRETGEVRWKFDTEGMPLSPVIAGDKVIVSADGTLFMLALGDGELLWSLTIADEITSPAVVQRHILVGAEDGAVVALTEGHGKES